MGGVDAKQVMTDLIATDVHLGFSTSQIVKVGAYIPSSHIIIVKIVVFFFK